MNRINKIGFLFDPVHPVHPVKKMFSNETQLDDALSEPTPAVNETLAQLNGDMLILGVAGKMGPSMARMARRALNPKQRVIGVARFSDGKARTYLQEYGVETITCDLLDETALAKLPDAENIVYLAGRKFGSTGNESLTWAMNVLLPGVVAKRFHASRIVALSTGNVYGLAPTSRPSQEDDPLQPVGEYATTAVGRERMFEYASREFGTRTALIRLNYACDLRYGVLVDLAQSIIANQPIDVSMGHFNTIWQGDANALSLQAFAQVASPPFVVNVTSANVVSVRYAAERLGKLLNRSPKFTGSEASTALIADANRMLEKLGPPRVSTDTLIEWVAHWVARDGRTLNKPTHFESRDGAF